MIFKNIVLYLISSRLGFSITQNLNGMAGFFQRHFSGTDNLRVVSIILLLLAFVLFLFLVIILYIKSLLSFIRNDISPSLQSGSSKATAALKSDLENEKRKELELEEELEKSRQARLNEEESIRKREERRKRREEEDKFREENARKIEKSQKENQTQALYQKSKLLNEEKTRKRTQRKLKQDFDWKNGRVVELDEISAGVSSFKYEPSYKTLDSLTGLILNMFSRYIDSGKIAQTVKVRCGDNATEEDIIQLIDAMKNFISLCNNGKFANLPNSDYLPSVDEALYNLAMGNSSDCLILLENLMNFNVDKGHSMRVVQKREIAFMEASNYACTFGTLASLNDKHLATSAFELAIELSPKNVNAWSRVADMYSSLSFESKAIWSYQNVINIGDEDIYPHQVANAHLQLSQYYYSQGDIAKAKNLYEYGSQYYSSIGINQDLTPKEYDIISIIESKEKEDIEHTIDNLLNISNKNRTDY